jgi:hypothetical protein
VAALIRSLGALPGLFGALAFLGGRQVDTGSSGFGEADRHRLLGRPGAMFPLANVVELLSYELTRLGRGGFPLAFVLLGPVHRLFIGHDDFLWLR